jgi:aspartate/methionine/tyrosine aminotransferase
MFMAILMFGEPGAEILYPDPGFPIYRSMIEFTGATPIPVPIREENGFRLLGRGDARSHHAAHAPHDPELARQPTGGVTPKREIDALAAGLARHPDVAIMSDEIYAP